MKRHIFLISILFLSYLSFISAENQVVSITSTLCDSTDQCYVHTGTNEFIFDTGGTVTNNTLYFTVAGQRVLKRVDSCSGTTCTGTAKITCPQTSITLTLSDPVGLKSLDDDGRHLVGTQEFICDDTPPTLNNTLIATDTGNTFYASYDTIIIKANLTNELSEVYSLADFSKIGGEEQARGTCTKNQGIWQCTTSGIAGEGPITGDVTVTYYDAANNTIQKEFKNIQILKNDETSKVDAWKIEHDGILHTVETNPTSFNKDMIQDFTKYIFIKGRFSPKISGFSLLKADISQGCSLVGNGGVTIEPRTQIQLMPDLSGRKFAMTLAMNANDFPGDNPTYTFNCTFKLSNKKGTTFIKEQEEEWFTFTLNAVHTRTTPDELKAQQENLKKKIEKNNKRNEYLYWSASVAMTVCDTALKGKGISSILEGSASAAFSTIAGAPAGKPLDWAGEKVGEGSDVILKNPFGKKMCDLMTCDADFQTYLIDAYKKIPGYNQVSNFAQQTMGVDARSYLDPYKSEPIAWGTACFPAIVYNLQKRTELDCEYLRCLNQDVPYGFPASQCADIRGYLGCKHTYGGIVRALPFVGIFQDMSGYFQQMLANPWTPIPSALMYSCRWAGNGNVFHSACGLASDLLGIPKLVDLVRKMAENYRRMHAQANNNFCQNVIDGYLQPGTLTNPWADLAPNVMKCGREYCMIEIDNRIYARDLGGNWYVPRTSTNPNDPLLNDILGEAAQEDIATASTQIKVTNPAAAARVFMQPTGKQPPNYFSEAQRRRMETDAITKRNQWSISELETTFPQNHERIKSLSDEINIFQQDIERDSQTARVQTEQIRAMQTWLNGGITVGTDIGDIHPMTPAERTELQLQIDEAIRKRRETSDRIDRTQDHINTLSRQRRIEMNWENSYGTGWRAYATAMEWGRAVSSISTLFNPDNDYGSYSDAVDTAFEKLNDILHFEDYMCKKGVIGYSRVNNLVINNAGGKQQSGAHIEGSKEGPMTDANGRTTYNYLITGAVIPKEGDNFKVKIIAKGDVTRDLREYTSRKEVDDHGTVLGYNITMIDYVNRNPQGEPVETRKMNANGALFEFTSSSIIALGNEDKNYNQVCIVFEVDHPADYFDTYTLGGNQLCNTIVG